MNALPSFSDFFQALWGHPPFPWQARLASHLDSHGKWPACLALPTGTGKTSALDIAIYHLASQARLPSNTRTAPVRIVFAVNRRIVVDEAYERVKAIAAKLAISYGARQDNDFDPDLVPTAEEAAVLRPVAAALRGLSGIDNALPLEAYPLRGATFTDHSWARTPTQPLVLTTTIDQLGSRLLFRGYGVSPYARPLHAALLANDALLILDEAHTAKAFSQTLSTIERLRTPSESERTETLATPFATVQLTATPPTDLDEAPFDLDERDHDHRLITKRLNAAKPATLLPKVEGAKGASRHAKLATEISTTVGNWLNDALGPQNVLVVVNRVATAEAVHAKLTKSHRRKHDIRLLTGRIRPLDREHLIQNLNSHLSAPEREASARKLVLVATQTVEVGADYDFDALATELAPLDSLRQRFGRLNRTGREIPAPAAIFAPEEALDIKKPDPIYGECLPAVWQWLHDHAEEGVIDFGLAAMLRILPAGAALDPLLAPAPDAPLLLAPHLDLVCQTSPEPHVSPDPAIYIHGPGRNFADISVVLRADLPEDETQATALLETFPPLGTEAATIPLPLVRNWLTDPRPAVKDPSGDTAENIEAQSRRTSVRLKHAYRFHHGEPFWLRDTRDLAPGDVLILSVDALDEGLDALLPLPEPLPKSRWALDHYERAGVLARDQLTLRFHSTMREHLAASLAEGRAREHFHELTAPLFAKDEEDKRWRLDAKTWAQAIPAIARHLAENLDDHPQQPIWQHAARFSDGWRVEPIAGDTNIGALLTHKSRLGATPWPTDPVNLGRQGDQQAREESLLHHSTAVAHRTGGYADLLPAALRDALTRAASHHDLGKRDPRFQAMLRGQSIFALAADAEPLAKSAPRNRASARHFWKLADVPDGFRHELVSTLAADLIPEIQRHPERDLILHLIASHHGRCRAMAPVIPDPEPEPFVFTANGDTLTYPGIDAPLAHIASGVTTRFWSLTRRFGWWGLPYLESLLRLADQYESANPSPK